MPCCERNDVGLVKNFHSVRSSTFDMHSRHRSETGRLVVVLHSRYIWTHSIIASGTFAVTCSLPEMMAPVDCCVVPMNSTGGLSMYMPSFTGFGSTGACCSLPNLSFDCSRERVCEPLGDLPLPSFDRIFFARPGNEARLRLSMLPRRPSAAGACEEGLLGRCFSCGLGNLKMSSPKTFCGMLQGKDRQQRKGR